MIICYAGLQGAGKTTGAVDYCISEVRRCRAQVFTNMVGLKIPEAVYIPDIRSLPRIQPAGVKRIILLDELAVAVGSRHWQDVDREVLAMFRQVRKRKAELVFSAQSEEHVDKQLRDQMQLVIRCRKVRRGVFVQVKVDPWTKRVRGVRFARYSPAVYACFDTYARIGTDGGTVESGPNVFGVPSYAGLAPASRETEHGSEVFDREPMFWYDGRGRLCRAAAEAAEWMVEHGYASRADLERASSALLGKLRLELHRRAWLDTFGLGPDDVPHGCSFLNPWLRGCDPATMQEWRIERDTEEAARVLAIKQAARRGGLAVA